MVCIILYITCFMQIEFPITYVFMLLLPLLAHLNMNLLRETFEWLKIDLCLTNVFFVSHTVCATWQQVLFKK